MAVATLVATPLGATADDERVRAAEDGRRAGKPGLDRLWSAEEALPTPADVDAPGLWLARLGLADELPDDEQTFEIPDDLSELDE